MKTTFTFCAFIFLISFATAQPGTDTTLKEQKENVIKETTIIKVENLGPQINTENPEMRPTISADGNLLFFIRQNDPANIQYQTVPNSQDIWYSTRDSLGKWSKAKHLSAKVNASQYNAVYWISPDLNTILLKGAFIDGQYLGMGVSMIHKRPDNSWTNAEMLKIRNFNKFSATPQIGASMGHDGKTLLFYMTDKKGSFDNDIYVSFLEGNDIWSAPKSLGKKISKSTLVTPLTNIFNT